MNQKGYVNLILIVLFIIIVGGAAGYFYWAKKTPTPVQQTQTTTTPPTQQTPPTNTPASSQANKTVDWKTYTSDLMGIEVKYPPKYYVVKNIGNPGSDTFTSVTYLGKESDKNFWGRGVGGTPPYIQLIYHANRRNLSITDLSKEWTNSAGVISSCKNLTIIGENALRCSLYVKGEGGLYEDMIFLKHSNATYGFSAGSSQQNDIVHSDLLEILSTLKFSQSVNWESLIPSIRSVIGSTFLGVRIEESGSLSISQKADITGDGINEALVNLGSGGAYTSYLTLLRVENDKPVVAQFKQRDGKVSSLMLLAGASVMNGESVTMLPEKNAIYVGHWSRAVNGQSFGSLTNCSVEAYQWNPQTKTFDFNTSLSNEVRPGFCQKVEQ